MSNAPAGWYLQADGRQRYWDGERWTEHFAPAAPMVAPARATAPMPQRYETPLQAQMGGPAVTPQSGPDLRPWFQKKRFLIPGGLIAFVIMVNAVGGDGDADPVEASSAASTSTAPAAVVTAPPVSSTPAPTEVAPTAPEAVQESSDGGEFGRQSGVQRTVVAAVVKAQKASEGADNDLARGAALRARTTAICKAIPNRTANKWTGKVVGLDANGDGKGVLEIEIAPDVVVKTWNNSFSDMTDETLIEPSDPLFDKVLQLKEDQVVTFSGEFPDDDANCIRENSITLRGSLDTPGFIMKFSDVS